MTLPRFFASTVTLLGVLAGLILALALRASGRAIVRVGEDARVVRATQIVTSIENDLGVAEQAVDDFERALAEGAVDDRDAASLAHYLTAELISKRELTDLTFTSASLLRYADDGTAVLAPGGRRQVSAFRDRGGRIGHRSVDDVRPGGPVDPTEHDTFRAAADQNARGRALWSDISFSELDAALPLETRRKTMTVQKAVFVRSRGGLDRFVGVLRAGLVSETLDRLGTSIPSGDPHRVFICDRTGRLVTRLDPRDRYSLVDLDGRPDADGDLRVVPTAPPAAISAALALAREGGLGGTRMRVGGEPHFLTLLPIAEGRTQDWLVGVVVPERHYIGPLLTERSRLLVLLAVAMILTAAVGAAGARIVGRGVRALVRSTEAMRRFSFERSAEVTSPFREVRGALESVERAKTALRAMVKYVPVGLVRRLYESGRDPLLGAAVGDVTVMFTDIADFTVHAEALAPDALAEALGRYLEVATRAVEATGGTVNEYVGDALMVVWNAPCRSRPRSPPPGRRWRARPRSTRSRYRTGGDGGLALANALRIHTDDVLVGNFGAPQRLITRPWGTA